jgi:GNAT superfamily N-acetyltransferase
MALTIRTLERSEIPARLVDLARLRIAVFREWPYLYDGDAEYERRYLADFADAADAVLVAACDGETIVGMATASPLAAQASAIRAPLAAHGLDLTTGFYFGESVLLPAYRGRGAGHGFFDHREAGARRAGAAWACFCAVIRPADHPLRPAAARTHSEFWTGRGYAPISGLTCTLDWRDLGEEVETPHRLQFWRGMR